MNAEGISTDRSSVRGDPPVADSCLFDRYSLVSGFVLVLQEVCSRVFRDRSAVPFTARKNRKFWWDEACQESIEELNGWQVSSPVLTLPRDEGKYIVTMDA